MKRALVTGSAGFIGRHMTAMLEACGWDVLGVDIAQGYDAVEYFRRDGKGERFELVVHCAYHVGGRVAIDGPNLNLAFNLELDAALFKWAQQAKPKRVVYFSSSAAYPIERQTWKWSQLHFDQDLTLHEHHVNILDPGTPDANYGWAKVTGERMAAMARECGVPVTVLRPFSGYGDDQSTDYPFPSIVGRAIKGEHMVWGPRGQMRDWIHVSDVIGATLAVVEGEVDGPVNLCTGRGVDMGLMLKMAVEQLHARDPLAYPNPNKITINYRTDMPTGVFHRVGNPAKMLDFYKPKVTVEEGISRALRAML